MDPETIQTCAEIGAAIGTFALAIATYKFAREASGQAKCDRITKEMDLLISPLMIVYQEIQLRGKETAWWKLNFGEMHIQTNPIAAQRFRGAINSIDQYKYLAPEDLRQLISDFILKLKDMERGKDSGNLFDFKIQLIAATDALYYSTNVMGGLGEHRRYELTKRLDALNENPISKIHDLFADTWLRLNRRLRTPKSKLIQPTQLL